MTRKIPPYLTVEFKAAITTFLTMMYILVVNPDILSNAISVDGVTKSQIQAQLLTATALSAAAGTLIMGLWARYPFALAPGMGLNAFFAFSVCLTMKIPWQDALGAVFVAGVLFVVLSLSGLREKIINAIPRDLKKAMAAGIGLFLAIIGFQQGGLVVDSQATLIQIGNLGQSPALLCLIGVLATAGFMLRGMQAAILIGIAMITIIAIFSNQPVFDGQVFQDATVGIIAWPAWPTDLLGAMRFGALASFEGVIVIFSFLFVDFFDTAGTLMGVSEKAGFCDAKGKLPRAQRAYMADGVATLLGATLGSSPTTTYIESAAGIEAGGRSGRVAVMIACLFVLSIFFWPLTLMVPSVATAPALIMVGALMVQTVRSIEWGNMLLAVPCFIMMVAMPFTYSISNGIALGLVTYSVLSTMVWKWEKEQLPLHIVSLTIVFAFLVKSFTA